MFYESVLSMVEQNIEQEFTVLPMPMYEPDLQNNRYYTHFSNTYDMYSIPAALSTENRNRSSAVLECLASEAFRRIGPAYFDVFLKSRNVSDSRMTNMYDKIRDSIVYDMGYLYGTQFRFGTGQDPVTMPIYRVRDAIYGNASLAVVWNADMHSQFSDRLEEIISDIRTMNP